MERMLVVVFNDESKRMRDPVLLTNSMAKEVSLFTLNR